MTVRLPGVFIVFAGLNNEEIQDVVSMARSKPIILLEYHAGNSFTGFVFKDKKRRPIGPSDMPTITKSIRSARLVDNQVVFSDADLVVLRLSDVD